MFLTSSAISCQRKKLSCSLKHVLQEITTEAINSELLKQVAKKYMGLNHFACRKTIWPSLSAHYPTSIIQKAIGEAELGNTAKLFKQEFHSPYMYCRQIPLLVVLWAHMPRNTLNLYICQSRLPPREPKTNRLGKPARMKKTLLKAYPRSRHSPNLKL